MLSYGNGKSGLSSLQCIHLENWSVFIGKYQQEWMNIFAFWYFYYLKEAALLCSELGCNALPGNFASEWSIKQDLPFAFYFWKHSKFPALLLADDIRNFYSYIRSCVVYCSAICGIRLERYNLFHREYYTE